MVSKGQVTAFIILGIVIVAIVGLAFYFRNQLIASSFESERQRAENVPGQIRPVKAFMDKCVSDVGNEAVDLLGFQGGYINLPESSLPASIANPFSSTLRINKNSQARVAYWSYQEANGIVRNNMPSQLDIEKSIGDYLDVNLNDCLDGLDQFQPDGFNITRRGISNVDARIQDNNIQIIVSQPIAVRYKDVDFTIEKHFADIEKPLGKFYDLAKQIANEENNNNFLEEKTIDMLTVYDELPYSDTDFECRTKIWTKSQVVNDFKDIASSNIAAIRVKDSNYRLADRENSYFELEGLDGSYQDTSITFRYLQDWPTKIEIDPSEGELLKGESINQDTASGLEGFLTSLFCLTDYHFVYNIKYPVVVSLNNGDYNFQYATQVIIDHNQAKENKLGANESLQVDDRICQTSNGNKIIIDTVAEQPDGSLRPINDVEVSYKCITTSCSVGTSQLGRLQAEFPVCINGVAIGQKDRYVAGRNTFSSNENVETSLILKPLYTKKIDVQLIDKNTGGVRKPFNSEQVIFEFINDDYSTSIVWPDNQEVTLAPGNYQVNSYVIGSSTWDINIASKQIENCVEVPNGFLGIFGSSKQECKKITVPGTTLQQAVKGGANFNFNLDHRLLAGSNSLVVYTMVQAIPGSYDELANVYDSIETNALDSKFRYPEYR